MVKFADYIENKKKYDAEFDAINKKAMDTAYEMGMSKVEAFFESKDDDYMLSEYRKFMKDLSFENKKISTNRFYRSMAFKATQDTKIEKMRKFSDEDGLCHHGGSFSHKVSNPSFHTLMAFAIKKVRKIFEELREKHPEL